MSRFIRPYPTTECDFCHKTVRTKTIPSHNFSCPTQMKIREAERNKERERRFLEKQREASRIAELGDRVWNFLESDENMANKELDDVRNYIESLEDERGCY